MGWESDLRAITPLWNIVQFIEDSWLMFDVNTLSTFDYGKQTDWQMDDRLLFPMPPPWSFKYSKGCQTSLLQLHFATLEASITMCHEVLHTTFTDVLRALEWPAFNDPGARQRHALSTDLSYHYSVNDYGPGMLWALVAAKRTLGLEWKVLGPWMLWDIKESRPWMLAALVAALYGTAPRKSRTRFAILISYMCIEDVGAYT